MQDKTLVENKDRVDDTISETHPIHLAVFYSFSSLPLVCGLALKLWFFGSKEIAVSIGIQNELIGFSVVAVGTSLPRLAASIALLKKLPDSHASGQYNRIKSFNIGLVGGVTEF